MNHLIAPSILAANFANLQADLAMLQQSQADWLHLDVMDGRFVPNISFGFPIIKAIKQHTSLPLDVHLMMVEPERYLTEFKNAGADILTVHYETCTHLHRTISEIKTLGLKAGVALNPHTPVLLLNEIIAEIDVVCLMSVNPGFGGQSFLPRTLHKIRQLDRLNQMHQTITLIEIDGGVKLENAKQILQAGANVLVAGSSIFKAKNPVQAIQQMKNINVSLQA